MTLTDDTHGWYSRTVIAVASVLLSSCVTSGNYSVPQHKRDASGNFNGTYSLKQLVTEPLQTSASREFSCPDSQEEQNFLTFVREGQAVIQGPHTEEKAIYVSLLGNFYAEYSLEEVPASAPQLDLTNQTSSPNADEGRPTSRNSQSLSSPDYRLILQGKLSRPYKGGVTWAIKQIDNVGCRGELEIERI